jgi:hypothetical protein
MWKNMKIQSQRVLGTGPVKLYILNECWLLLIIDNHVLFMIALRITMSKCLTEVSQDAECYFLDFRELDWILEPLSLW